MLRNIAIAMLVGSSLVSVPARGAPRAHDPAAPPAALTHPPITGTRPEPASSALSSSALYRGTPGSVSDEKRYAAREAQSPAAKNFRAGDVVVISASAVAIVLLIVVLILLL